MKEELQPAQGDTHTGRQRVSRRHRATHTRTVVALIALVRR